MAESTIKLTADPASMKMLAETSAGAAELWPLLPEGLRERFARLCYGLLDSRVELRGIDPDLRATGHADVFECDVGFEFGDAYWDFAAALRARDVRRVIRHLERSSGTIQPRPRPKSKQ